MGKRKVHKRISIRRRTFVYFMGITFLSVFSLGFFWLQGNISRFEKEIQQLRKTFSETKRDECRYKILEIKDYILWLQFTDKKPVTHALAHQTEDIVLPSIISGAGVGPLTHTLPEAYKDSLMNSRVPVFVIDPSDSVVFSFDPLNSNPISSLKAAELEYFIQKIAGVGGESGTLSRFRVVENGDSILISAAYFNNTIIPGFRVVSVATSDIFDAVLMTHLQDSISRLRFAENEYVFINTFDGRALVTHGKSNDPPIDILASGDTAWINIFRVQQTSADNPGGVFHTYTWSLLSSAKRSSKTSYFSFIPVWEWIIGTGFYEDDVNLVIKAKREVLITEMRGTVRNIFFYLLVSAMLCYLLVIIFSRQIGRNIKIFNTFFEKAATENHLIDKSEVTYREFISMADSANLMVSERKKAEAALKESELQYRYLFEQNPVPLMIYETATLSIVSVNEAFIREFGFQAEEALQLKITDLCREDEKEAIAAIRQNFGGLSYIGEWHHLRKDGTQITVEIDSHGFLYEGNPARIVVINDITERKKVEDRIRELNASLEMKVEERTSLLEAANKELESFSYSISHDLRAPLRHINGFLELLSKRSLDQMDEKSVQYLRSISAASTHMGLLIDDLLNFSRTGRMEMKPHHIDMNRALSDALAIMEQETSGRNIEWRINQLPLVYADYSMIRQVWVNLISNAIKYTRKRDAAVIEVGCRTEDTEYVFYIRDNGTGFDMNYSQKLFGVFQRLHTNEEFEGTGIGLANVRQVITRHRGRTWAEGEVDAGATFYFSLPFAENSVEQIQG